MADRILEWYLPENTTNQAFCLDRSYALPAVVRINAGIAPDGGDLVIDILDDGVSIFGSHRTDTVIWRDDLSVILTERLTYTTPYTNFVLRETVTGQSSGAEAIVINNELGRLELERTNTIAFTAEEIIGSVSLTSAYVSVWMPGGAHTKQIAGTTKYISILPKGKTSEDDASNFDNDATLMEQYSWITLDVVQSGGAKQISVQLELNHEYQDESDDEED